MKRQILIAIAMALAVLGVNAQYFRTPFYTEGFDSQQAINQWTVETTLAQREALQHGIVTNRRATNR